MQMESRLCRLLNLLVHGPLNLLSSARSKHAAACGLCLFRALDSNMFQQSVGLADFPHVAFPKVVATNVGVQRQAHLPRKYQSRNSLATLESAPLAKIYQRQF